MSPVSAHSRRKSLRRGFTLIELLVAVVIISVLIALIAPAIIGAQRAAKEAAVRNEISDLAKALTAFKATFGHEPPSSISLYHTQAGWTGDPASMAKIRQIWPEYDFTQNDLGITRPVNLNGAECLAFFLGGVPSAVASPQIPTPTGFAKSNSRPFQAGTASRHGPFIEFNRSRTIRTTNPANTGDTNLIMYVDGVSGASGVAKPFLYFSSYEGGGYVSTELTGSGIANIYLQATGGPAWNTQSFQIISAGMDGDYGSGGVYDTSAANNGLANTADYDNITNITTTPRLKP